MTDGSHDRPMDDRREFREEADSLIRITLAPCIWAVHFVLCYSAAAVACAKVARLEPWLLAALAAATCLALAAIAWIGWRCYARWSSGEDGTTVHSEGTPEDRHHFLGHAGVLLAILSFIAVVFVSLPLVLIGGCQ
jgi:hypothetical protein